MRWPFFVIVTIVAAVLSGQLMVGKKELPHTLQAKGPLYRVAYVYDGDTVKLSTGERVRLIGIDTPEAHDNPKLSRDVSKRHIDRRTQLKMGQQAMVWVRSWLMDKDVRLEYDVQPKDRYGRTLGYLYLADGTFVNEKIIREGYAYPLTIPPNVRFAHQFKQWFDEARNNKRGLWQ